jgi:hypothetical protein
VAAERDFGKSSHTKWQSPTVAKTNDRGHLVPPYRKNVAYPLGGTAFRSTSLAPVSKYAQPSAVGNASFDFLPVGYNLA